MKQLTFYHKHIQAGFRTISKLAICLLVFSSTLFFSVGCATITRGKTQPLIVNSEPIGANVELSNGMNGTTPWTFELPRKNGVTVTISKEGFETTVVNVVSTVSSGGGMNTAGNIIFGGLIGLAIDGGSGAMKDLTPNPVFVTLIPVGEVLEDIEMEQVVVEQLPEMKLRSRLRELRALLEDGDISKDEYDQLKQKLLSE